MIAICAVHNKSQDCFVALQQNFPESGEARRLGKERLNFFNRLTQLI
jgi:hypothetical protein